MVHMKVFNRTLRAKLFPVVLLALTGCAQMNLAAIPSDRVPPAYLARSRANMQELSLSRLRRTPPVAYTLAPGDILGVYIEYVLGQPDEAPPVHFPQEGGGLAPALGFPVPVGDDGNLSLPLVAPINVTGLTIPEATAKIRKIYVDNQILQPGKDKVLVTLIQRRFHRVLVIREEEGAVEGVTKKGTGMNVDLPAYENDVLHALNETGGLPGEDARNEIIIIKGGAESAVAYDRFRAQLASTQNPCQCPPIVGEAPGVKTIPLQYYPENLPNFTEEDVILETGDIVVIPSRDVEKFYTGGVLEGGEHLLPRDYDINVLQAIAITRGSVGTGMTSAAFGPRNGQNNGGFIGPSQLIVLRKGPCGEEIAIEINMNRAISDPSQRLLVQPEDTLILSYTCKEKIVNALVGSINLQIFANSFRN